MNELTTNGNVLNDLRKIIEAGRKQAYAAAGQIAVATYWNIGRRIVEEEQHGQERAKYGTNLIANYCCPVNRLYVLYHRRFQCDKPLSGDEDG